MKYLFFITLLIFTTQTIIIGQKKKIALVIGNANYQHGNSLKNPVNDAELMARTLTSLNFRVTKKINATRKQMTSAIVDFSKQVKNCETALFYYAGHGIQVDGVNYIIPVDAKIDEPVAVKFEAMNVQDIVSQFEFYTNQANIVILDACRENPFLAWVRGNMNSFAPANAPRGTFIAYATGSGSFAYDGTSSSNGLYTGVLANEMLKAQRIEDVFINTRNKVYNLSNGKQQPQEWSQLSGSFYFTKTNLEATSLEINKEMVVKKNDQKRTEESKNLSVESTSGRFIDPSDKRKYKWVKIGKQKWMAENSHKFVDTTNSFYYEYNKEKYAEFGRLYTWEGAQKACPTGWHLPTKREWKILILGLSRDEKVAPHLKSTIEYADSEYYWPWAKEASPPTNSSGFNALHSGYRQSNREFYIHHASTTFWTATEHPDRKTIAFRVVLPATFDRVFTQTAMKYHGCSVRCIKDK